MAISKKSYEDLKEYWDYQRLLEYNKELLKHRLKNVQRTAFSHYVDVNNEEVFDNIWNKMESEDYESPMPGWIPENIKYRFEWEGEPDNTLKLEKPKGRPVVLRAKTKK